MKWNSRKEDAIFNKIQDEMEKRFKKAGMDDEQIASLREDEHQELLKRRNQAANDYEEVLYTQVRSDGTEYIMDDPALQYEEDICEDDPFQYGFNDERLNKIVAKADVTDMEILRLLSKGLNQRETGDALGLSQQFVSYRIKRFKKRLK